MNARLKKEILAEGTDTFLDEVVEDLSSEKLQKVHKDIETLEVEKDKLKNKFTKFGTDFSNLNNM